jgi:hypothetical protein
MNETKCEYCGKDGLISGTLEGVSFVPSSGKTKFMEKGVYGLTACACTECGRLSLLKLDTKILKKILK